MSGPINLEQSFFNLREKQLKFKTFGKAQLITLFATILIGCIVGLIITYAFDVDCTFSLIMGGLGGLITGYFIHWYRERKIIKQLEVIHSEINTQRNANGMRPITFNDYLKLYPI